MASTHESSDIISSFWKCKKCGEDDELVLMIAAVNGEPRHLCQKCGEMN